MLTDPHHFKRKVDNGFITTIIATVIFKLALFSFLIVINFILCLFQVLIINFSALLTF